MHFLLRLYLNIKLACERVCTLLTISKGLVKINERTDRFNFADICEMKSIPASPIEKKVIANFISGNNVNALPELVEFFSQSSYSRRFFHSVHTGQPSHRDGNYTTRLQTFKCCKFCKGPYSKNFRDRSLEGYLQNDV